MEKCCSKCKVKKPLESFGKDKKTKDGHNCYCKECARIKSRLYRINNLEKVTESKQKWNDKNPDYKKSYYQENKEVILDKVKTYRLNNLEVVRERDRIRDERDLENRRLYLYDRYHNDPMHKMKVNLRTRMNQFIKKDGITTIDLIGCSYDEFKKHIESQFTPQMNWNNHGVNGWHLDHIYPLAKAKDETHLLSLFHHTNIQPLWWNENLSKSDKLPQEWLVVNE